MDAFIWDSSRLEYEAAQDCDLATATEQFARSGYGIGLPKGSFWTERVNKEVLAMHESGLMEELDHKWILQGDDGDDDNCPTRAERQKPATLGLSNMAGVFILVGVGIIGGIGLIAIEVIYKKSQVKQQRQLDVARGAAERWKRLVEVRPKQTQTDPLTPRSGSFLKKTTPPTVTPVGQGSRSSIGQIIGSIGSKSPRPGSSRPQSSSSLTRADIVVDDSGREHSVMTQVKQGRSDEGLSGQVGQPMYPQAKARSSGKKHRKHRQEDDDEMQLQRQEMSNGNNRSQYQRESSEEQIQIV